MTDSKFLGWCEMCSEAIDTDTNGYKSVVSKHGNEYLYCKSCYVSTSLPDDDLEVQSIDWEDE